MQNSSADDQRLTLLLRGNDVAKELGISRALAYRWMASGILPVVRVPGSKAVRCPRGALLQWIDQRTQAGSLLQDDAHKPESRRRSGADR
jgi:excisionase family DNA binding protein